MASTTIEKGRHGIALVVTLLVAALLTGGEQTRAADLLPLPAEAVAAGDSGAMAAARQAFHEKVALFVKNFLDAEIQGKERMVSLGNRAVVAIKYRDDGSFKMASVTSRGYNKLAATLHDKMHWKRFPTPAQFALPQKLVTFEIGFTASGEATIDQM
jgi:hypothetical protein